MDLVKKTTRHYKPKRYKRKDSNTILYRKLYATLAISGIILIAMYFWVVTFFSNINNVWEFFSPEKGGGAFRKDDNIPPAAARLLDIPEATKEKELDIKGFGEEGAKAELYLNGELEDEQIIDTTGIFTFEDVKLNLGENSLYVLLTDKNDNQGQPSTTYNIEYDNKAPKLVITEPEGNEQSGDNLITIAGISEEGAYVTVNERFARVKEDDGFEIKISLSEGDNSVVIEAKDKAGNVTRIEKNIHYTPDSE